MGSKEGKKKGLKINSMRARVKKGVLRRPRIGGVKARGRFRVSKKVFVQERWKRVNKRLDKEGAIKMADFEFGDGIAGLYSK